MLVDEHEPGREPNVEEGKPGGDDVAEGERVANTTEPSPPPHALGDETYQGRGRAADKERQGQLPQIGPGRAHDGYNDGDGEGQRCRNTNNKPGELGEFHV